MFHTPMTSTLSSRVVGLRVSHVSQQTGTKVTCGVLCSHADFRGEYLHGLGANLITGILMRGREGGKETGQGGGDSGQAGEEVVRQGGN